MRKLLVFFLLCNSLKAMEWNTRCAHSYELLCCSLVGTLISSGAIAEGIIQQRFPDASLMDHYMGSFTLSPKTKLKGGIGLALLSTICSQEPEHSCLMGNLGYYSQCLVQKLLGSSQTTDIEKKLS
ncbi:TPA: hypothetical protein DIC20_03630 [Candidatus Dependentiae bacterium]|nr:MAG: hypothetical protein US03_C0001G0113 [candidate division TM6 bacterium GW2011_GWF2_36_131]KKQ03751.1 MAG: hypothetical protein US13_C0001G0091 [candidate division TM6 bacterium GW2011_GWE2_36_25]KKQ19895.1 MAG: hypothetical protein US32_C0003G0012 [candidate division TM6 bacterium GW2011_GWA2_36_9]HBR70518.1 hypothetical protein [Candidatus Dependentiae bacterium]HCU00766.1 hypothetical protein [Candidatus Dependentiae bacterium]